LKRLIGFPVPVLRSRNGHCSWKQKKPKVDDRLVVHEFGDRSAPSVLLLHGLTESGRTWPDAVERWHRNLHLFAADLRGHGDSPRFSNAQLDDAPGVLLADVLRVLGSIPSPVAIVGHSLGGLLALRAAAQHDGISGLVLEDPAQPSGSWIPDPDFVAEQEDFLDRMMHPATEVARMRSHSTWTADEIEAWGNSKRLVDRNYIRHGLYLGDGRWEELFNSPTVPTLLVVPENSAMAPVQDDITNPLVIIERVPGAGHCVRRDRPNDYHALVDPFLRSLFKP
jgi:pimeloyl-ACP methyl ester carboxylesterase